MKRENKSVIRFKNKIRTKILVLISFLFLLITLNGCKYKYTQFVTDALINQKSDNIIIQDSLIKFTCSVPKQRYAMIELILCFKTKQVFDVDSLAVSIKLDNQKYLRPTKIEKEVADTNGLTAKLFHDTLNNKSVLKPHDVKDNIILLNNYPVRYRFIFPNDDTIKKDSILVNIKAILKNKTDIIRYYKDFKLFAKIIEYYD